MRKILIKIQVLQNSPHLQHGAVLLLMLVILVVGTAAMLLNSLNSTTIRLELGQITAEALAKAKEALIGRAASDPNRPGELPCPDIAGDGQLDLNVDFEPGGLCKQFVGYLPWKTLGLPELRDGAGVKLFYAVSKNFHAGSIAVLNSDTRGQLSIQGDINQDNIAAIVFAPGAPLCSQSRSGNNIDQYLEAMSSVSATSAVAKTNSNDCADSPYNDNLLAIIADHILQPVEKRIVREAKSCLDDYAAMPVTTNGNLPSFKYPWAAPVSSLLYSSTPGTLFGRIPDHPSTVSDILVSNMVNAINALQAAVDNCKINNTATNRGALDNAGEILKNAADAVSNNQPTTPLISGSITSSAATAGDKAKDYWRCENINNHPSTNIVQQSLDQTNAALASIALNSNMSLNWPASCTLFSSLYWSDWKEQVFFQIADGYQPNGDLSCAPNCLSVSGTGNSNGGSGSYRAAVALAGKNLSALPRPSNSISAYLDGNNTTAPASLSFSTYRYTDLNYPTLNDVVICLDGKNNCK